MKKAMYIAATAIGVFIASFLLCGILDNLMHCKIGLFPREEILFHAIAFGLVWAAIVGYRKYKKMK